MKKIIYRFIYNIIGNKLPYSNSKFQIGQNNIRNYLVKHFITHLGCNCNIEKGAILSNNISIGNRSGIGINCIVSDNVFIGDDVMMGPECLFFTQNHKFSNIDLPMNVQGHDLIRDVKIGNNVWIGQRCIFLPGVEIPNGVIVGAGSVVSKTLKIKPYDIIAGNPARVIRNRIKQ